MMLKLLGFLTLCIFGYSIDLPEVFPRCNQIYDDEDVPKFRECFIDAAHKSRKIMMKGIPELGIPGIDGLVVPLISIEQKTRALKFGATLLNVTVDGLGDYIIENITLSPKNRTYWVRMRLPNLNLNGTYKIKGRAFDQGIDATGPFSATLNDTVADATLHLELYKRKNKVYANITDLKISPTFGKIDGDFKNLFGENTVLNKATSSFIEDSTDVLVAAAQDDVLKVIIDLALKIANLFSQHIPIDSIFPPKKP